MAANRIAPTIALGSGSGTLNFNQAAVTTLTSSISGFGTVQQLGTGTTILYGSNSYTGKIIISSGTLQTAGANALAEIEKVRAEVARVSTKVGRRLKLLVGKPGLDGHSNGAEQIAVRARDCGFEVVYEGIRLTPAQIVNAALEEGVHLIGLSILSGSHLALVEDVVAAMRQDGMTDIPLIVGGIIPPEDANRLTAMGVAAVYTPKDFDLTGIMADLVRVAEQAADNSAA